MNARLLWAGIAVTVSGYVTAIVAFFKRKG